MDLIIVKAKIKVLTAEEGGKRKPGLKSGYRPNHVFDFSDPNQFETYIGDIIFDEPEFIYPGEIKNVIVRFLKSEKINNYISIGRKWRFYEAPNLIAEAEILELL